MCDCYIPFAAKCRIRMGNCIIQWSNQQWINQYPYSSCCNLQVLYIYINESVLNLISFSLVRFRLLAHLKIRGICNYYKGNGCVMSHWSNFGHTFWYIYILIACEQTMWTLISLFIVLYQIEHVYMLQSISLPPCI